MSYLDPYSYQHLYPYPYLYPYQYHLRHIENASWERGFVDVLAEKKGGSVKKLWPMMAGHKPLMMSERYNRLDSKHHPDSVAHDWVGVQALRHEANEILMREPSNWCHSHQ